MSLDFDTSSLLITFAPGMHGFVAGSSMPGLQLANSSSRL